MSLFSGSAYICATDADAAVAWYREKLGCGRPQYTRDDTGEIAVLTFDSSDKLNGISIGTTPNTESEPIPVLFSSNVKKAHAMLVSQGVDVDPIQTDRQGNEYFQFRDLDGNVIEVCNEF